jgi:hypothetical protein
VLSDPERTLADVFEWLGDGDVEAAVAKVEPALRTQTTDSDSGSGIDDTAIEAEIAEVFDELHDIVVNKRPLHQSFVDRLNEVNQQLSDRIAEAMRATRQRQQERKKAIEAMRRTDQ